MTSETPDMFYPIAVEEKELEMLIIASKQNTKTCSETFIQSNFEGALTLKVELENLKLQIISEIKDLIFNEIS